MKFSKRTPVFRVESTAFPDMTGIIVVQYTGQPKLRELLIEHSYNPDFLMFYWVAPKFLQIKEDAALLSHNGGSWPPGYTLTRVGSVLVD